MAETTVYPPPPGAPLTVGGRELLLPRIVQADKAAFSAWAGARAIADVRALEAATALPGRDPTPDRPMSRDDFFGLLDEARGKLAAGGYAFHERDGIFRRTTDEGLAYVVWTCLKRAYPPTDARDPGIKFADVLTVPVPDLTAAYNQANADPNRPAPGTGRGTPTDGIGDGSPDTAPKSSESAEPSSTA